MPLLAAIALAVLAAGVAFVGYLSTRSPNADSGETNFPDIPMAMTLDQIFSQHADAFGLDPDLPKAVAMQESSLNPRALRNRPPNDVSAGLMQVLLIPGADGHPTNFPDIPASDYDADAWRALTLDAMFDANVSVYWGTLILASYLRDFGFPRGVARYNMRRGVTTAPVNGPFPNQDYVNRVLKNLSTLKGA